MPAGKACTDLRLTKSYRRVAYSTLGIREPKASHSTSSTSSELGLAYDAFAFPGDPNKLMAQ